MTWVKKFAVLGLAAVGGTIALRCIPVETRHRVTRAAGDWVNKKMLDHMERVLASLPEAAPPRLVMSILPKLEAQNERILALLRERADRGDIIRQVAREEAPSCRLSEDAWSQLAAYPFPGNMRQLRYVLRLAGCTAENGVITDADLDLPPFGGRAAQPDLVSAERAMIVEALRQHGGRVTEAARALKLSRATLYRKIKQLKIETAQ